MPLIEANPTLECPLVSRFTFERTQGPALGLKDIGDYYTLVSNQTVLAAPGTFGLGIGGFLNPNPPRNFGLSWQGLARSTPAPLQLGTTSQYSLQIDGLYYHGRNLWEIETFLRDAPNRIGPYAGTLKRYRIDGTTLEKTYSGLAFYRDIRYNFDGSKNFVEYSLIFETTVEPT